MLAFYERAGRNSRLGAIGDAQFVEHYRQLILDRTRSDAQVFGDRLVREALRQQLEDLPLLLAHRWRGRASLGTRVGRSKLPRELGRQVDAAVHDELDPLLQQPRGEGLRTDG